MQETKPHHIKPLWAMLAVAVVAFIAGGIVVLAVVNSNLQAQGLSVIPYSKFLHPVVSKPAANK